MHWEGQKTKEKKNVSRFFKELTNPIWWKNRRRRMRIGEGWDKGGRCEGIWRVLGGGGRIRTDANAYSTRRPTPLLIISARIQLENTKNNRERSTKEMGRDWKQAVFLSFFLFINSRQGHDEGLQSQCNIFWMFRGISRMLLWKHFDNIAQRPERWSFSTNSPLPTVLFLLCNKICLQI